MRIRVTLTENMLGTVPKDKEVYKTYIGTKKPETNGEDESQTVEEIEEKGWTGFMCDTHDPTIGTHVPSTIGCDPQKGLFVWDYYVKGFLKHAGNVLKEEVKVKALRSKIDDFVFVFPRRVYLNKEKPDGILERPLRAQTMQGPRVTLARSDFISAGSQFEFEIKLYPPHKQITEELIKTLLDYGQYMGFGQFRNGGYGRFTYEVVK